MASVGAGVADVLSSPLDRSPFGLYDMTGNIAEACVEQTDPLSIVSQGGAWPSSFDRFLKLGEVYPSWQMGNVWGFRIVRTASPGVPAR